MTKRIIAVGHTANGVTTTTYAPEPKAVGTYAPYAVAPWSELQPLIAMAEAANVRGMEERIASARAACAEFEKVWVGDR